MDTARLKQQIESGEYRVDPAAVADAILRRLAASRQAPQSSQNECSYPDSSPPSASTNATAGDPSTTDPIHVRPIRRLRGTPSFSRIVAVRVGTQTHSS